METETIAAFDLLARMRFACGDNGTRMQDELEEYLRVLLKDAERYRRLRDEFTWSLTSNSDGTRLSVHMPGVSLTKIGPHSDEFDAAIDATERLHNG